MFAHHLKPIEYFIPEIANREYVLIEQDKVVSCFGSYFLRRGEII